MEITLEKVSYHHIQNDQFLYQLSFSLQSHSIYGILGTSGSGKTMLLDLLSQTRKPTEGKIKVPKKKRIGYLKQDLMHFFLASTVKEELKCRLYLENFKVNEVEKRSMEVLKMVGLDSMYLNRKIDTLSRGEQTRVALASALICNPQLIFLDEPTIGYSDHDKKELIRLLKQLKNKRSKIIVVVSHDVDFIHALCDQIIVMSEGKVVMMGDKYHIFEQEKKIKSYHVSVPKIIAFENMVKTKKKIDLGYRDQMNDLIKDVFRHVS